MQPQPWLHFYSFGDTSPGYNLSAHLADSQIQDPFILKSKQLPWIYSFIPPSSLSACSMLGGVQCPGWSALVEKGFCSGLRQPEAGRVLGLQKERPGPAHVLAAFQFSLSQINFMHGVLFSVGSLERNEMTKSLQLWKLHPHLQSGMWNDLYPETSPCLEGLAGEFFSSLLLQP